MIVPASRAADAQPPTIAHPVPRAVALDPVRAAPPPAPARAPHRYRWAELMRRVFEIARERILLRCGRCGGTRKIIAVITDPFVVRRILRHLELPSEPPPTALARPPPQAAFAF